MPLRLRNIKDLIRKADTMGNSDISQGIDMGAYPNPRTFTIGLNAKF
jgi:hypothetical protein